MAVDEGDPAVAEIGKVRGRLAEGAKIIDIEIAETGILAGAPVNNKG